MSYAKLSVVLSVILLLGTVAVVFREMDRSRERPGAAGKEEDAAQRRKLAAEIDGVKTQIRNLASENEKLKKQNAELSLRKEELKVCRENLKKVRSERSKCDKWAIKVDDEKEKTKEKFSAAKEDLEQEKRRSEELAHQVDSMTSKLTETRRNLEDIEKQKESAMGEFSKQQQKYKKLKDDLTKAKQRGQEKNQDMIEEQLSSMNKDLKQKSNAIDELTAQKKASDRILRRLEGKLLEAGVDPAEIEKMGAPPQAPPGPDAPQRIANPAAAAMMQVGQGKGEKKAMNTGMADIVFGLADDNGDLSIDLEEFIRHVRPRVHEEARQQPSWRAWLSKKFRQIDTDQSGFITKTESARNPSLIVQYLVSQDEMSVFNGTRTVDQLSPAKPATGNLNEAPAGPGRGDMPVRKGLLKRNRLGKGDAFSNLKDTLKDTLNTTMQKGKAVMQLAKTKALKAGAEAAAAAGAKGAAKGGEGGKGGGGG